MCGLIAALILVVGYLASSSQGGAIATAAAPAPSIVMPVEVAVSEALPAESATETVRQATVPATTKHAPTKRVAPKKRVTKRRPIRIDASMHRRRSAPCGPADRSSEDEVSSTRRSPRHR